MIGRERGEHMPELSRDELLARISSEYYLDNRSKVEIGASYGVSRFQVARLLTEAREKGIVEIKVHFPSRVSGADIRRIESSLGIGEVVVADTSGDAAQDRGVLFVKGSDFLLEGGSNTLRLAYSGVTADQIDEGVRRLAGAIRAVEASAAA